MMMSSLFQFTLTLHYSLKNGECGVAKWSSGTINSIQHHQANKTRLYFGMNSSLAMMRGNLPRMTVRSRNGMMTRDRHSTSVLKPIRTHTHRYQSNHSGPPKSQDWKRNGTPEMLIGGSILAILAIDQGLQMQQENDRKMAMEQIKSLARYDDKVAAHEVESQSHGAQRKILFKCIIRRVPKFFDGNMVLKGGKVGEVVEVLEERVGPDGMYHKVRYAQNKDGKEDASRDIGWFPISCLEKGA